MPARTTPNDSITLAILAGGRAERMGGLDKGLQPLRGRTLVACVDDALRGQGLHHVLIVANRSHEAYLRIAPTISDALPGQRGPLAGIAAALAACATHWLLTVPVDCPDPPPDLVARLHEARVAARNAVAVAHDGERRQPLFALYDRELAAEAACAAQGGLGVAAWQDRLGATAVDFTDRRAHFANLNTLAELAAYAESGNG